MNARHSSGNRVGLIAVCLLLCSANAVAQPAGAAYPLTATVQSSHVETRCFGAARCTVFLEISAIVNGHHLDLETDNNGGTDFLVPGDYKAKVLTDDHVKPYLSRQSYELWFPDGATKKFSATGESK